MYPTNTTSAASSSNKHDTIAIALGTTFGILGLVAGGLATAWYFKRSREREPLSHARFILLGGDLERESTDGGAFNFSSTSGPNEKEYHRSHGFAGAGAPPLAVVLTHLGLSKHSPPEPARPRRDMFADEDTRQFGWGSSLPGMSRREGSTGTGAWSLHSMSAIVRSMMSREPSTINSGREWDKIGCDREGLVHEGNPIPNSGRFHGRDSSWSYTDPFSDPVPNDTEYDLYQPHLGALELDGEYDNVEVDGATLDPLPLRPHKAPLPLSAPIHTLSPLHEVSHTTESNAITPCPDSSQTNSSQSSFPSQPAYDPATPPTSYTSSSPIAPSHRHTFLDSHSPTSHPIRRSDSWWGRFMKAPLLDRRSSTGQKPLDFRDPNSAPRLMSIEESKLSSDSSESKDDVEAKHDRLATSSVKSGRTANTEVAERLGRSYDIVQRLALDESASIGSTIAIELGLLGSSEDVQDTSSSISQKSNSFSHSSKEHTPPSRTESPSTPGPQPTRAVGNAVSSRIHEFEQRMANSLEAERSPPPRNTRKREEVPSRTRPNIQYGLAPRPSLYVTNPENSVPTS